MAAHLLFKLGQFRENGEFIDVRLKVDKSIFPAHRNVLAAYSDYFHAMFTNGMKESNQEMIELKDENISALGFKVVMNSIYSGELLINKKNVFEVLTTASHLQMPTVVRQCCDFLDKEYIQGCIDIQTCLRLHAFADLHGLRDLKEDVQRKMASLYSQICESEEFFYLIDADQLLTLLSRDDLSAPSETFVFKSVMLWIKYKKKERMPVAAKVIGAVRLGLVDTKVVVEELNTREMQRVPEIQTLMCEKLLHSNMPSPNSKFAVEKTRPRSMTPVSTYKNFSDL